MKKAVVGRSTGFQEAKLSENNPDKICIFAVGWPASTDGRMATTVFLNGEELFSESERTDKCLTHSELQADIAIKAFRFIDQERNLDGIPVILYCGQLQREMRILKSNAVRVSRGVHEDALLDYIEESDREVKIRNQKVAYTFSLTL